MDRDAADALLPTLTAPLLAGGTELIDNRFARLWKQLGMPARLRQAGFSKHSGTAADELVYHLILWIWLKADSIGMFVRESLQVFCTAQNDALYAALNREDWNWRRLHQTLARLAQRKLNAGGRGHAFVLDDSIKTRQGKRMPGVSSHFDHTTGRHVMEQQVLTLGLSSEAGFVPLDSELYISSAKAQALRHPFADGRSVVAQRYRVAEQQSKLSMTRAMLKRAQRAGFEAEYVLADAWFGNKVMLEIAEQADVIPILRMKTNASQLVNCSGNDFALWTGQADTGQKRSGLKTMQASLR